MPTDDLRATYRTTATVGVTLMATVVLYAVIAEIMHVYLGRFDGVATAFAPSATSSVLWRWWRS